MTKDEIDQRMSEMDKRLISEEMTDKETLLVSLFEKKVGGKIIDGFFRKFFLANVQEMKNKKMLTPIVDPKAILENINMILAGTKIQISIMTAAEGSLIETADGITGAMYLISDNLVIRFFANGIWNNAGNPGEYVKKENGNYYWK